MASDTPPSELPDIFTMPFEDFLRLFKALGSYVYCTIVFEPRDDWF
jgi:hypothetical protein